MDRPPESRAIRVLLERGLVTREQIDAVWADHGKGSDDSLEPTWNLPLLDSLISRRFVDRAVVAKVLREVSSEARPPEYNAEHEVPPLSGFDGSTPSFPAAGWERFECLEFLGRGGMGTVFKARDRRLDRVVALKFLRGDRPELVERFAREARAQAKVEHPNICNVYEVGEVGGSPYIAMQLVDGRTFKEIATEMPLEGRVKLMQDVSRAVHEAHRMGLIHRDLKPSNIMIENNGEGLPHAYVMDFGLARQLEERGQTITGDVLGSPAYMSPEQARGAAHSLDRRSDVYSLGATLYHLLVGRPPFQGTNPVDTLLKVQTEEPAPLRRHDPNIPADLEAIVLRCLQKAPQRRYESARALAEDLERFLDGRPPALGRHRLVHRILGFFRHHPRLAAAAVVLVLAGIVILGVALRTRSVAAQRRRMAQLCASEVERIDGMMRVTHLMPLHDIRPDRERVRRRMAWILEALLDVPASARSPGWYALGRAHLTLGEYPAAREQLQAAWDAGFREPEVAWAYGVAMGRLYEREVEELYWVAGQRTRTTRRLDLDRQLRDEAVSLLGLSEGTEGVPDAFAEALIAHYEDRAEDALALAQVSLEAAPWFYEARMLQGAVHSQLARTALSRGSSAAAADAFRHAGEIFRDVTGIAPSDPESYAATCRMWRDVVRSRRFGDTDDLRQTLDRAVSACDRALAVDSMRVAEVNVKAACYLTLGDRQLALGEDPGEAVDAALASAGRVLKIEPENSTGLRLLGRAHTLAAAWWNVGTPGEGREPVERVAEWTEIAVESLMKASALAPEDAAVHLDLGRALAIRARFLATQGEDARQVVDRAQDALGRAAELSPGAPEIHLESARCWLLAAHQEDRYSSDPITSYDEAVAAARRTIAIRPDHLEANYSLGRAHLGRAEHLIVKRRAAAADLASAIEAFQQSLSIDTGFARAEALLARAASLLAEQQATAGTDPTETLILGRAAAERSARLWPDDVMIQRALAALLLISAENSPHRNQRLWWGERAVDLLSRLPEEVRDVSCEDHLERARRVVREESG
jgi:tetratricopeptide (TPR) repeat protein/tRNA A-37 threonylcarbamoyl transferase component Bud32